MGEENLELDPEILERFPMRGKKYIRLMVVILAFVFILDDFVSKITVTSFVIQDLLVEGQGMDQATADGTYGALQGLTFTIIFLQIVVKMFLDKVGRKPILILSIIGMGVGALVCAIAPNIYIFFVGISIMGLFLATDVQYLITTEESPNHLRATMGWITTTLGTIGALFVPLTRWIFLSDGGTNWRAVFYSAAVISVVAAILNIIFIKETRTYLIKKFQREKGMVENVPVNKKGNMRKGFGYLVKSKYWKDFQWTLYIRMALILGTAVLTTWMEPILSDFFTTDEVTLQITIATVIGVFLGGLISWVNDKIGRKNILIITLGLYLVSILIFSFTLQLHAVWLTGILYTFVGMMWAISGIASLSGNELVPTDLRGTSIAFSVMCNIPIGIISTFGTAAMLGAGIARSSVFIITTLPGAVIGLLIAIFKIKETKGIDLNSI